MIRNPMIRPSVACRRTARRAAAAVEFALIAPIFFVLLFGVIEFGRVMMVQEILVNAAREGARAAILNGSTDTQVQTTVSNYMSAAKISGYSTTVSPTLSSNPGPGTAITVTVSVPWSQVTWTGGYPIPISGSLSSTVVMIHE